MNPRDVIQLRRLTWTALPSLLLHLTMLVAQTPGTRQPATPSSVAASLQHASAALAQGDTTSAERDFRAVVAADPKNVPALANLGALLYKRGSYAEAKAQLGKALLLQPNLWDARALLGLSEQGLGEADAALRDLEPVRNFGLLH